MSSAWLIFLSAFAHFFLFFTGFSLNSQKIASSQKCRKFCHQVQLTNLEGREGTFANTLHYCIFCNIFWIYGHSQSHFCDIASTILTSSSLDLLFGHFFIESAKSEFQVLSRPMTALWVALLLTDWLTH